MAASDSITEKVKVTDLARLLREELRQVRFSVARMEHGDIKLTASGGMSTILESNVEEEHDADSLREYHDEGSWKRDLFRSPLRIDPLPSGSAATARCTAFEELLDDIGVLSDGHVAHALGSLLPGFTTATIQTDSPEKTIGVAKTMDLWRYALIDACLETPRRTATKLLRWARGGHVAYETCVLLGRLRAPTTIKLANGITVERLPDRTEHLAQRLRCGAGIPPSDYLGRTLLRISCTIAPGLSRPTKITRQRNGPPADSWEVSPAVGSNWSLPAGGVNQLVRALSLVCDIAVEAPVIWSNYGDHAHFGQRYGSSMTGGGDIPPRHLNEFPLTSKLCHESLRLQPKLLRATAEIETAIRYWLKSKARDVDVADALVYRGGPQSLDRLAANLRWYLLSIICCQIEQSSSSRS